MSRGRRAGVVTAAMVLAVAGCTGQPAARSDASAASSTVTTAPITPNEPAIVEVRAPPRAPWVASLLAPARPTLRIRVTNPSDSKHLDVRQLRAILAVDHAESDYRCESASGPPTDTREPSFLAPKASFAFDRTIDCALPLTGTYDVTVSLAFGASRWARARPVHAFGLRVDAPERLEPKRFADGKLWAAVGASTMVAGEGGRGAGRIAILIVNGSAAPVAPPALRLGLRVYRKGSPIPCEDEPLLLTPPPVLAAGAIHRQPVEVSCLGLHTPGDYEVVARLIDANGPTGDVEVGRLAVAISNDPAHRAIPPR